MSKRVLLLAVSVATVFCCPCDDSSAVAADTLYALNVMRAHTGRRPYTQDPRLQYGAEAIAQEMARRRITGHIGWHRRFGARAEGTGRRSIADHRGHRFLACYSASRRYRHAGAASVVGRDGRTYYCLLIR